MEAHGGGGSAECKASCDYPFLQRGPYSGNACFAGVEFPRQGAAALLKIQPLLVVALESEVQVSDAGGEVGTKREGGEELRGFSKGAVVRHLLGLQGVSAVGVFSVA